ncbi:hypothetical protein VPFG_00284 [Vibrio phage nt-1]|uniref:Uncharacterized protein n=1 Tax=Vibrio phage nt-1 TaxID=115992 RepID=R9TGQ4_9CAUD|nr:hypothetical protein VPFG_00284 [Vibrio phage nt-1]AGN30283.1 hypothetical protein VPFG_00284 [Vibrio phage nt-1]
MDTIFYLMNDNPLMFILAIFAMTVICFYSIANRNQLLLFLCGIFFGFIMPFVFLYTPS